VGRESVADRVQVAVKVRRLGVGVSVVWVALSEASIDAEAVDEGGDRVSVGERVKGLPVQLAVVIDTVVDGERVLPVAVMLADMEVDQVSLMLMVADTE